MKQLPEKPNLRNLKNQAKALLKAHGRQDPPACETLRLLRRFSGASDPEILGSRLALADAQYALALDYGFASWTRLKQHVETMQDEATAARARELVAKATAIYTSKGPSSDSTGSEWDRARRNLTGEFLKAGEAGSLADVELSRSENARTRREAAVRFGIRRDTRSKEQLALMLHDRSGVVRRTVLRWYAAAVHPESPRDPIGAVRVPANEIPPGLAPVLPMVGDTNAEVRLTAVHALASYTHLDDAGVDDALRRALEDPKHKVHHAAAKALGLTCPGCGAMA